VLGSSTDPPLIGSPPTSILRQVSRPALDFADSLTLRWVSRPGRPSVFALNLDVSHRGGMFDVGVEPWGDPPPFGMPVFVVTHERRDPMPMQGGTTYRFVTEGIQAALEQARAAAGGKDVGLWGGGRVISGALKAGLLDEIQLHLVPLLLGDGRRLFVDVDDRRIELERTRTIETVSATHLTFRVTSRAAA
jgi:dihydrofolate reductase